MREISGQVTKRRTAFGHLQSNRHQVVNNADQEKPVVHTFNEHVAPEVAAFPDISQTSREVSAGIPTFVLIS
ncbi:hypothetical protein D3C75_1261000 [compost metagenome]